jgi:hypothetical protein
MKNTNVIAPLAFGVLAISGCGGGGGGGASSYSAGMGFGSASIEPKPLLIGLVGDESSYPQELLEKIRGEKIEITNYRTGEKSVDAVMVGSGPGKYNVDLIDEIEKEGLPLLVYGGDSDFSEELMSKLVAAPRSYAFLRTSNGSDQYVYSEKYFTQLLSLDLTQARKGRADSFTSEKPRGPRGGADNSQIASSTVNGQKLITWTSTYTYRDFAPNFIEPYANITLKIIGTRNDSAMSNKGKTIWTISAQGQGFNGRGLYRQDYASYYSGAYWMTNIPLQYFVELGLEPGGSKFMPTIETYAPANTPLSTTINLTTGWKIGLTGSATATKNFGGTSGGGSGTLGVGFGFDYTQTESRSFDVKDGELVVNVNNENTNGIVTRSTVRWGLNYRHHLGYRFSQHGAGAFLTRWVSAYDSNMLLNNFSVLAPVMQAYTPMYNILYSVPDIDKNASHLVLINIGADQWYFNMVRNAATFRVAQEHYKYFQTGTQRIQVKNSF